MIPSRHLDWLLASATAAALLSQLLGLLSWAGYALDWMPLHIVSGFVLVAALWIATLLAVRARLPLERVVIAGLWGFAVIGLGYWQVDLLPGEHHRRIRIVHMIVGMAALRQIFWLVKRMRQDAAARSSPAAP